MCLAQVGSLLPRVAVPAVMSQYLIPLWNLSGGEAGLMASSFAISYMLAVPILATLTDRKDARIILLLGSALSSLATLSFGLFASDFISATLLWGVAGVGFAGAYMPGLKALTDRLGPGDISRSVTLYSATFSIGVGLSFLIAQVAADWFGWRAAFIITSLGPLTMVAASLGMVPLTPKPSSRSLFDIKPILRNRTAMGYILGYGAHCFELYALRTWIVAFWTYVMARDGGSALLSPITVSFIATVIAMPSSIIGNEAAIRYGRHGAIISLMCISTVVAATIAFAMDASPTILLALLIAYSIAIPADAGALTSGMSASAHPDFSGTTMALFSMVGFGLSAAGGWAVGIALDAGGGMRTSTSWLLAFLVMSAGGLFGPLALLWSGRQAASTRCDNL
jgi:MFS family permease